MLDDIDDNTVNDVDDDDDDDDDNGNVASFMVRNVMVAAIRQMRGYGWKMRRDCCMNNERDGRWATPKFLLPCILVFAVGDARRAHVMRTCGSWHPTIIQS